MAADDDDALFPLPPVEETEAVQKEEPGPVEKSFRPYDPNQVLLLPPSLEEWLPERHLGRFVSELVEEALDLSAIRAAYTEERGYPPYDPRLMVKLLIYGYCTGQRSSRVIEKRCHDDVAFRYLAAGAAPDYRSIARFRRRHLEALAGLFLQALQLCQKAGMVRLGKVALDGTKLRANASRHKAMSYKRMVEREAQLEAEIDAMLAEAERVDRAEDERFGPDGRDDDLPEELNRRVDRLLKIQEAKQALEEEARRAAAEKAAERAEAQDLDEQAKEAKMEAAASKAVPKPKGAAQLHRPRRPNHEDVGRRLSRVLQRPGGGRRCVPGDRGRRHQPVRRRRAQPAADAGADRHQLRQVAVAAPRRLRLLRRGEPDDSCRDGG